MVTTALFTYNALDQCVRAQSPPNIFRPLRHGLFLRRERQPRAMRHPVARRRRQSWSADRQIASAYDGLDRLTEIALAVDATHALTNRFVYDGNDQCVQVLGGDAVSGADPHQTVAYEYDERGLLFREIAAPGSGNSPTNEFMLTTRTVRPPASTKLKPSSSSKLNFHLRRLQSLCLRHRPRWATRRFVSTMPTTIPRSSACLAS